MVKRGITEEQLSHLGDDPLPEGVYAPSEAAIIRYARHRSEKSPFERRRLGRMAAASDDGGSAENGKNRSAGRGLREGVASGGHSVEIRRRRERALGGVRVADSLKKAGVRATAKFGLDVPVFWTIPKSDKAAVVAYLAKKLEPTAPRSEDRATALAPRRTRRHRRSSKRRIASS